jgi:hypothetical protein
MGPNIKNPIITDLPQYAVYNTLFLCSTNYLTFSPIVNYTKELIEVAYCYYNLLYNRVMEQVHAKHQYMYILLCTITVFKEKIPTA